MKNIVGESFAKVLSFANDFKLSPALSNEKLLAISKSVYKKEYPLLVWKNALNEHSVINGNQLSYLNESVSDISTSFFLFLQGFYKPAQFILRSAIENFIKFLSN